MPRKAKKTTTKKKAPTIAKRQPVKKPTKKKASAKKPAAKATKKATKKLPANIKVDADAYFYGGAHYKVYINNNTIYSKTLNLSNIGGNNNKFYILQILQIPNSTNFATHFRWGRVGVPGKWKTSYHYSATAAVAEFNKKFSDKTKKSGYTEIEIDFEEEDEQEYEDALKEAFESSSLEPAVNDLVNLIFDTKLINKALADVGYDVKKMPLGKLSEDAIEEAYEILDKLMAQVLKSKGKVTKSIENYSSQFYTQIPHDFGFSRMRNFVLNTEEKVKEKLDFLDTLKNMKITKNLTSKVDKKAINLLEQNYGKLNCDITALKKNSKIYKTLKKYFETGLGYSNAKLEEIYEINRHGETERYNKTCKKIKTDYRRLMWHGSRITNFVGILSEGLRIAPPSAPCTGYRFDKGIYLADLTQKSYWYCTSANDGTTLILLIEAQCGDPKIFTNSDCYASSKLGKKNCCYFMGSPFPDPKNEIEMDDGTIIPMGPGITGDGKKRGGGMNEWVFYDVGQVRMRYLLKFKR